LSRLSARSVLLPTEAGRGRHWRPAPPRRAQNLLAGCIFDGAAVKSAFALLLTRVTEPRLAPEKGNIMKRTISVMLGNGSVNHNSRKFKAENVDGERTHMNISYCNESIKKVYHELFDEALKKYNEKQTRADRRIDNYYEKISNSKQEKSFYEIIIQIGNKDDMSAVGDHAELAMTVLNEYYLSFQERNPSLRVFSAHLHMDEATPHLHIDFIPFITGSNRSLETRVSLKKALATLGFNGGTRGDTEWNQWVQFEKEQLAAVMERHGIEWEQKGTHEKHLSVLNYEKEMRAAEVAELDDKLSEKKDELITLEKRIENFDLGEKELNDVTELLDNNSDFQLSEPTALMSAKSYKQKIVEPLITKMKAIVQKFVQKYFQMKDQYLSLQKSYKDMKYHYGGMQNENEELTRELTHLQNENRDYRFLRKVFGDEQIDKLIEQAREIQQSKQRGKRVRNNHEER
jgi:hypothetical protein